MAWLWSTCIEADMPRSQNENAPANRGAACLDRIGSALRPLRIDLGVVALGVPLVDDIVDLLDVALGVELDILPITVSQAPALIVSMTFFGSVVPAFFAACDQTWIAA